jgi:peptide/nickel transport system substrate-binding protein
MNARGGALGDGSDRVGRRIPEEESRMPSRARRSFARLVAAIALALTSLLPAVAPAHAADKVILKVGTIENLRSLNPYQAAYFPDYETFQLNFNLLVDFGPKLEPIPGFADKWQRAADGKSWTFHIRTGMKWSDGQPATSADACYSYGLDINAIKDGTNVGNGYIDPSLKDARVTKATCPDPETMILTTDDGTSKILQTYIPILPQHIYGKEDYKKLGDDPFKAPLVGTGPYIVADYTPDEHVHFVRNPNYWGKQGYADEIYIQIFKQADTMVQALKTGDIQYARGVPVEQFNALKGQANIQTVIGKNNGWVELGFNNYGTGTGKSIKGGGASTKALQDVAFRDAIGYAIDKQALVDKVRGGYGDVGSTQVPPVLQDANADPPFAWHTDPANPRTFDIAMAKSKLDAAGYVLDASGNRLDKEGKPISLHLVMPSSEPSYPQVAQFIQDWLGQLGIKVKSDVYDQNALYDIMLPPEAGDTYKAKFDLFIWSWYGSPDPNALLQIFLCNQIGTSSDSLYCNKDYDTLYNEQNLAPNDQQRKVLMDQLQNLWYDQAPYHILYYDNELDAYRTDVFAGWQNQPLDSGVPLFTYSVIDYTFLTNAKAPPSPSPSTEAPVPSGSGGSSAAPAPTGSTAPAPSPTASTSSGPPLLLIILVIVVVIVIAGYLFTRRRGGTEEEE